MNDEGSSPPTTRNEPKIKYPTILGFLESRACQIGEQETIVVDCFRLSSRHLLMAKRKVRSGLGTLKRQTSNFYSVTIRKFPLLLCS